jgi:hypothetical protein
MDKQHISVEIEPHRITWRKNGLIGRDDGPAVVHEDGTMCWYKDGLLHRDDGPAIERRAEDGTILRQAWYRNGLPHSHEGRHPALLELLEDGSLFVQYMEEGVCTRHEAEGPALSRFMASGNAFHEFRLSGVLHRSKGPAIVNTFSPEYIENAPDRVRLQQAWYRYGKLSREDGPAEILEGNAGRASRLRLYSIDGEPLMSENDYRKVLKERGLPYTREIAYKPESFQRPQFMEDTHYPDLEHEFSVARELAAAGGAYRPEVAQVIYDEAVIEAQIEAPAAEPEASARPSGNSIRERGARIRSKMRPV